MWQFVRAETRLRYFLFFGPGVERALQAALVVALGAALAGIRARAACLASALLLYHLAPLESVVWTPNPYLRGLTIPLLGLLVLCAAPSADVWSFRGSRVASPPSWEYRWPLALVQVFFCGIYFFSAYAKLYTSGIAWLDPSNLQCYLTLTQQSQPAPLPGASLALAIAESPKACAFMAASGLALDFAFPLVLFVSLRLRYALLALMLVFHVANSILLHIFFQNAVLLLLFVDWASLARGLRPPAS